MALPPSAPPRWARIADFLCLLLVVTAVIVAISGGFRVRVVGVRLALTSPVRLLLWTAAIVVLRHILAPQVPVYRDLPARLGLAWQTSAVRTAVAAVIGTRLVVLFVGYLSIFLLGYHQGQPPWRIVENEAANLQARWDTGWYLGIAVEGYSYRDGRPQDQQNIVFFPALPMLMRSAGRLLGGASTAYLMGGTLVVFFTFLGALVYLYHFARDALDDDEQARRAVWLLAAYPFALFYSAVYTESIYLLGAVGAFYHFSRRQWWAAAGWGLLVGLTRPNGCFLAIPLGLLAAGSWLPQWLVGSRRHESPAAAVIPAMLSAAAPGIGVLLYSVFVWQLTGDPLAWAAGHAAWGRSYQGLSIVVSDRFNYLAEAGLYGYSSDLPDDLLQGLGVVFVLAAAWPVARRLGLAYAVFILINILPPMAAGQLLSAGRFSSVLFPAFVWFGGAVSPRHWPGWVATFMAVQALNAALFYTWRPMF